MHINSLGLSGLSIIHPTVCLYCIYIYNYMYTYYIYINIHHTPHISISLVVNQLTYVGVHIVYSQAGHREFMGDLGDL